MSLHPTERQNLQMMLELNIDEDGSTPLSDERRKAITDRLNGDPSVQDAPGMYEEPDEGIDLPVGDPSVDLQTMITEAVAQAVGQAGLDAVLDATAPPQSFEEVLADLDPTDSENSLMMLAWLQAAQRLSVVATLAGNAGYLYRYQEPKGTTREGYTPGGSQGGRIVDAALEAAKASGVKRKDQGMCGKCYDIVERQEDGTILSSGGDATCPNGGKHTFNT